MKLLQTRLQEARKRHNVPWEIIERDYILSWILAGINKVDRLRNSLVFKGGTALKKCYFGDYRFSEDLDFTALNTSLVADELEKAIHEACKCAEQMLDEYVAAEIVFERYTERTPHPTGQEAFVIRTRFPWHRTPQARVMVEITMEEKLIKPAQQRLILHNYEEPITTLINVYCLEEIIAEKLRAILQHAKKLKDRGWSRSRARDYYDIWRILKAYKNTLNLSGFANLLHEKCIAKAVMFTTAEDFFEKNMLAYVEQTWEQWLAPLVPDLPSHHQVIKELRPQIEALISV